jgi:hypothetical protein
MTYQSCETFSNNWGLLITAGVDNLRGFATKRQVIECNLLKK